MLGILFLFTCSAAIPPKLSFSPAARTPWCMSDLRKRSIRRVFLGLNDMISAVSSTVYRNPLEHCILACPKKYCPWDGGMLVNTSIYWEKEIVTHSGPLSPLRFDPQIHQLPIQSFEPGHSPSPSQIDAWAIHITLHGWWSACFSRWSFEISSQEIAWKQPKCDETTQVSFGLD